MTRSAMRLYLGVSLALLYGCGALSLGGSARAADAPTPLLARESGRLVVSSTSSTPRPSTNAMPKSTPPTGPARSAANPRPTRTARPFAVASADKPSLTKGSDCAGTTDPVAPTFEQIYKGKFHYLVWNDHSTRNEGACLHTPTAAAGSWGAFQRRAGLER